MRWLYPKRRDSAATLGRWRFAAALALLSACGGERPSAPKPSAGSDTPPAVAATVPDSPTFADHVAPIIYRHCTACHHPGGSAPLSLTSYDEVRDHAQQIAEVTAAGDMPPWLPGEGANTFSGARVLSDVERQTLARWAEQGRPRGDPMAEPPVPAYVDGWPDDQKPDLVLSTPSYPLPADGRDVYRNFVIPVPPGATRFVRAAHIRPSDPTVVHHAVLRIDTTGEAAQRDAADDVPGFEGMEFAGSQFPDGRFVAWTPGKALRVGDDRMSRARAWRLPEGSALVLQLHMRPSGKAQAVTADVGLWLSDEPPTLQALAIELAALDIDLPPGATNVHVRDAYTLPTAVSVVSVFPHAHYLGKTLRAWAALPDGSERPIITIDDWDFDWQDQYRFATPLRLPKGSTVHMDWSFDNSAENPHNPSATPVHVRYGPQSTDEMAELILEIEPDDPANLAALDQDFRRKWLGDHLERAQRRVAADPGDADAHADLAAFLIHLGRTDEAIAAYEQALTLRPQLVRAGLDLAIALRSAGQLAAAEQRVREALKAAPDNARAHRLLAEIFSRTDRIEEAIGAYRRALAIDDTAANVHRSVAALLVRRGRFTEAERHAAHAVRLRPDDRAAVEALRQIRLRLTESK